MANIMCHYDWATKCSDICSNILLGTSAGGCLGEITFESVDWVKQIALPTVGGPHPISGGPEQNKRVHAPPGRRELLPA